MSRSKHQPPVAWETREDTFMADCRVFKVYNRRCYHPVRNLEADFSVIYSPEWVQSIALTPDNKIILVNQFRFGRESMSWEMPGGVVDEGEAILKAAGRELAEETGYTGHCFGMIGTSTPNPAIQNNTTTFVLFRDCQPTYDLHWDEHEELDIGIFSWDQIDAMVRDGRIHNMTTFNALYFLERFLKNEQ